MKGQRWGMTAMQCLSWTISSRKTVKMTGSDYIIQMIEWHDKVIILTNLFLKTKIIN